MSKTQKVIRWGSFILMVALIEIGFIRSLMGPVKEKYTKCGKVIDKLQPTTMDLHKYSADIEVSEYLVVDYGDGIVKENVDANTFYKYSIGSGVCFEKRVKNFWKEVTIFILALLGWILNAVLFILTISLIWYRLGDRNSWGEAFDDLIEYLS